MTDRTSSPVGLDQATLALEQFSGAVELFAEKAIRSIGGVAIGETSDKDIERIHRLADITQKYSDLMDRIFAEVNEAIARTEGEDGMVQAELDTEPVAAVPPIQETVTAHSPVSERVPNEADDENAARAAAIEQMIQQLHASQRTMHIGELVRAVFGKDYHVENSQFRLFIGELNVHPAIRHTEGPYYQIAPDALLHDTPSALPQQDNYLIRQQLIDALPVDYPMLDIIEILVNNSFSRSPFRIEELRATLAAAGTHLSSDEYAKLKSDFADIRVRTIEVLRHYGIQAYWQETGKTRAKKYKLTMGSAELESTDETVHVTHEPPIPQQPSVRLAGDNKAPERKKAKSKQPAVSRKAQTVTLERRVDLPIPPSIVARNAAQQLADRRYQLLLENLSTVGIPVDDSGLNALQIAQRISKRFDISDINACRQLVSRLRNDGVVHSVGSHDGYVLLSLSPPIGPKKKKRATEADKSHAQESTQEEWSENDTTVATIIARELLTLAHWQQGIEYADIVSNLSGYFPESKEQDIRRSIRRLCNAGYFETKETHKTGGPMSAKSHKFVIRFPSQSMKKQFKETPKTMVEEIELKILGL